ncbi:MAG: hypothetical protein EBV72_12825 [Betaproteobacteria bacterium]|nr:hypothetical protein [Betaproteobacteria bacterium]
MLKASASITLCLNPGSARSLQMHHHRAEHWIVEKGTAKRFSDQYGRA